MHFCFSSSAFPHPAFHFCPSNLTLPPFSFLPADSQLWAVACEPPRPTPAPRLRRKSARAVSHRHERPLQLQELQRAPGRTQVHPGGGQASLHPLLRPPACQHLPGVQGDHRPQWQGERHPLTPLPNGRGTQLCASNVRFNDSGRLRPSCLLYLCKWAECKELWACWTW